MRDHTESEYMARRRFFVDEVRRGEAEVSGDDAQHLTRVLRVEPGQRYEISDNQNVYLAEITTARKQQVVFRVVEQLPLRPSPLRLHLYAALTKFDRFEVTIEKATELGVERIVPVWAERTEHGLDRAAGKRLERWRRIGVEASQQSRRDRLPEIEQLSELKDVLGIPACCRFSCDEESGTPAILNCIPLERSPQDIVAVLIGPEGGWTDGERSAFRAAEWTPVSLGAQVLRAETAAIAALAILLAAWESA
jgi:16S rRNA (uracil1498-N3)-methyltransferase